MNSETITAESILSFALLHDWGRDARISNGSIANLCEGGRGEAVSFPATSEGLRALLDWAGY